MKLVIDVSKYQDYFLPSTWDKLATILDGVIIRCSFGITPDVATAKHVENAKRVGLPFCFYHWVDPTREVNPQSDLINGLVDKYKPMGMFGDYEQYWSDWAAYMRQDLVTAYATRFSPEKLNGFYKSFHGKLLNLQIPYGCYSADWFIDKYAPAMWVWIPNNAYWEARYLRYYDSEWWKGYQAQLGGEINLIDVKHVIAPHAGVVKGIARQFESYIEIPELETTPGNHDIYHLDWNVFTDEGFYKFFGAPIAQEQERLPETRFGFPVGNDWYNL